MAVALTSFIQPMLVASPSSDASVTNHLAHQRRNDHDVTCYPSPSVSHSSDTPTPSDSETSESSDFRMSSFSPSNGPLIDGKHCKQSSSYFDIESECNAIDGDRKPSTAPSNVPHIALVQSNDLSSSSSDGEAHSVSTSQCRYCYADTPRELNVSQCHCSGTLCKECLIKELQLTFGRKDQLLQCTVCKSEYHVDTQFGFDCSRHCRLFCTDFVVHCGLKDEQYLLESAGGKVGFVLVILGINTWIMSTSLLFAFPPDGCPIALYYMVSVFDLAVGVATMWFIVKCRYLSPLLLSAMYLLRFLYVLCGWMPSVNLLHIYTFHHVESNHTAILAYFVAFSLLAAICIGGVWVGDLCRQFRRFKTKHGRLVLQRSGIEIEVHDLVCAEEGDDA